MLLTEHRLWRGTVGVFTGLIVAVTVGAPALAASLSEPPQTRRAAETLVVPRADVPRTADASQTAKSSATASAPRGATSDRVSQPSSRKPVRERIALQPGDLDTLAHLVQAEAGDEPYAGKVGVVAVVINRIQSGRFPRTVRGVVFEQDAFEAVSNGWFWNPPTASAYAAVRDALRGWDPTGGALFFFNPAKTDNAFIWSRPVITQIGGHIFAR